MSEQADDKVEDGATDDAPDAPAQPSVGSQLKSARLAKSATLEQAADATRIRRALLDSLEQDDHSALPGGIYSIGFVRSYAKFLDLDPQALEDQWREEAKGLTQQPHYSFPTPTLERRLPGAASIMIGLAVLLIPVAIIMWQGANIDDLATDIPELPDQLQSLIDQTLTEETTGNPDAALNTVIAATGQPDGSAGAIAANASEQAAEQQAAVSLAEALETFGTTADQSDISLTATGDVWVQIRDQSSGDIAFTRVLKSGDRYFVPRSDGLILTVGDAGALTYTSGETTRALGRPGQVIRDIPLNAEGLATASR
ncbi:MAG: helix-turn-helix domain-containing protein [Alphaproteobacteria bacterium]|nr:helix-turn-helix domain-containing protein [Alphaproteobacteria bacterium SS10]